ncbi:hypothetical protein DRI50_06520 [candidate division KSB1 bacterium]|nr:MAG: hypothetical protein DRI50_06520 [candidate division KSB1 bacterium]
MFLIMAKIQGHFIKSMVKKQGIYFGIWLKFKVLFPIYGRKSRFFPVRFAPGPTIGSLNSTLMN